MGRYTILSCIAIKNGRDNFIAGYCSYRQKVSICFPGCISGLGRIRKRMCERMTKCVVWKSPDTACSVELLFTSSSSFKTNAPERPVTMQASSDSEPELEDAETLQLYPPSKKVKSVVWEYFGFTNKTQQKDDTPTCRKCLKKVPAPQANTSNLRAHLREKHPDLFAEIQVKRTLFNAYC